MSDTNYRAAYEDTEAARVDWMKAARRMTERAAAAESRVEALEKAGRVVVAQYDMCRRAGSMAGFWSVLDDLAALLDGRAAPSFNARLQCPDDGIPGVCESTADGYGEPSVPEPRWLTNDELDRLDAFVRSTPGALVIENTTAREVLLNLIAEVRGRRSGGVVEVRLAAAQQSALECAGLDLADSDDGLLREAWDRGARALRFAASQREHVSIALTELANAEDDSAERDRDNETRKYARGARDALTNLARKVTEAA
jgi:hypothetical protein